MNYLIRVGEECEADAVIFMHNDVELHPGTIEAYLSALENLVHSDKNWGVLLANGFLLAAMRMEAVKKLVYGIRSGPIFSVITITASAFILPDTT